MKLDLLHSKIPSASIVDEAPLAPNVDFYPGCFSRNQQHRKDVFFSMLESAMRHMPDSKDIIKEMYSDFVVANIEGKFFTYTKVLTKPIFFLFIVHSAKKQRQLAKYGNIL